MRTLPFSVLSGVKVRFCESLGCGRGTPGHLLMGGGVLKKKIVRKSQQVLAECLAAFAVSQCRKKNLKKGRKETPSRPEQD